jgi:hypothetical protein
MLRIHIISIAVSSTANTIYLQFQYPYSQNTCFLFAITRLHTVAIAQGSGVTAQGINKKKCHCHSIELLVALNVFCFWCNSSTFLRFADHTMTEHIR